MTLAKHGGGEPVQCLLIYVNKFLMEECSRAFMISSGIAVVSYRLFGSPDYMSLPS